MEDSSVERKKKKFYLVICIIAVIVWIGIAATENTNKQEDDINVSTTTDIASQNDTKYRHPHIEFRNELDVRYYLNGRHFISENGTEMVFRDGANSIDVNGRRIITSVIVYEIRKDYAVLKVSGPYAPGTLMICIQDWSHWIIDLNDNTKYIEESFI